MADTAFEKARCAYCEGLYDREATRKDTLEKKAQFHLSIVTLVLGAIFFKLDFLRAVGVLMSDQRVSPVVAGLSVFAGLVLGLALAAALVSVLLSMRLHRYKNEHPDRLVSSLFIPESNYLARQDEAALYRANAETFALATEHNKRVNNGKAVWVGRASVLVFVAALGLTMFLATVAYAYLVRGG